MNWKCNIYNSYRFFFALAHMSLGEKLSKEVAVEYIHRAPRERPLSFYSHATHTHTRTQSQPE